MPKELWGNRPSGPGPQNWQTPPALFQQLDQEFHFTVDAAASDDNHLCPRYWTEETDGLAQDWTSERVFCNPPFSKMRKWVLKASSESDIDVAAMITPAAIDSKWWTENVLPTVSEIRFIKGRVWFLKDGKQQQAVNPIGCTILIWDNSRKTEPRVSWEYTWPGRQGWLADDT